MNYTILHVSDIHCDTRRLREVLERERYDLVFATGDIECVDTARALKLSAGEVAAITGNMDGPHIYRELESNHFSVDGRIRE